MHTGKNFVDAALRRQTVMRTEAPEKKYRLAILQQMYVYDVNEALKEIE